MLRHVFVVDDDDFNLQLTSLVLEEKDPQLRIDCFCNGRQALDALERLHRPEAWPDAILLDLEMPCMDGLQFLRDFVPWRERERARTRVIVLSANCTDALRAEARALGAETCLNKPLLPLQYPLVWGQSAGSG